LTEIISNGGAMLMSARPINAGQKIVKNIDIEASAKRLSNHVLEMLTPNAGDGKKIGHCRYPR